MATNDFLVVAPGPAPNVASQATYAADPIVTTGNVSGVAKSAIVNKAWRQSSIMAAVVAQLIVDNTGQNAVDDGTTATLLANLKNAVSGRLINTQTFIINGTYTPTAGTKKIKVTLVGGGGGSGAVSAASTGQVTCGISGGGAGWSIGTFASGFSGASVVVGAGGSAGVSGGSNATAGGTSSFLTMSATGGGTGVNSNANTPPQVVQASAAGVGTGGNIANGRGDESGVGFAANATNVVVGLSGSSIFGGRKSSGVTNGGVNGVAGGSYGAGAVGACNTGGNVALNGAAGFGGIVIIEEFA